LRKELLKEFSIFEPKAVYFNYCRQKFTKKKSHQPLIVHFENGTQFSVPRALIKLMKRIVVTKGRLEITKSAIRLKID